MGADDLMEPDVEPYELIELACKHLGIRKIEIPKDQLARLGEAFFRVKTPDTARITGTGLGVSICKQIIEAHNGHLEVESEHGEGSTFRVLLPRRGLTASAGESGEG